MEELGVETMDVGASDRVMHGDATLGLSGNETLPFKEWWVASAFADFGVDPAAFERTLEADVATYIS